LNNLVKGGHDGNRSEGNLFIYSVPRRGKIAAFFSARKIGAGIVKKNNIEVITAQDPFFTGLIGRLIKNKNTGLNVEVHGDFYSTDFWKKYSPGWPFRLLLGKFILRRADGIRVVSERVRKSLTDKLKIPSEKIVKIPVFTETNIVIHEAAVDLHSKFHTPWIVMGVGSFRREKNFSALIKAMPDVLTGCPGARLVLIGAGPEERVLRALTRRIGLNEKAQFLGELKHDKMLAYLKQADVLAIPSLTESWSRVAVEAAALDVPVVMSNVGLAGEVIVGGVSGEVIGAANPQKLAEAVARILKEPNLRARYAAAAKAAISKLPSEAETMMMIKQSWAKVSRGNE
ncbi:MAG: glycosyltransferase family 4 protein, partial [Patescibacteria group bacterium]